MKSDEQETKGGTIEPVKERSDLQQGAGKCGTSDSMFGRYTYDNGKTKTPVFVDKLDDSKEKRKNAIIDKPFFPEACKNIPDVDVQCVKSVSKNGSQSEYEIRALLVINRWMNKICDNCLYKDDISLLQHCSKCKLAFYCSVECQKAQWQVHKLRCCKPDGPIDSGPMRIVFAKKDDTQ